MDCSLPGSSAHGIFQARVLEWVAIAFSERVPKSPLIHYHRTKDKEKVSQAGREKRHMTFNRTTRRPTDDFSTK